MSSFHDCMAQRLAHLLDHIGASVKEIHRGSKNGRGTEVELSMFISLGHSETLSSNERLFHHNSDFLLFCG